MRATSVPPPLAPAPVNAGCVGGTQYTATPSQWTDERIRFAQLSKPEYYSLANSASSFQEGMIEKRPIKLMGRTTDCRYAAESSSASKRQSQQGACLAKVEPRAPRHERRRVAIDDVAEKIRFHMSFREKLLLVGLTFASRKEPLIQRPLTHEDPMIGREWISFAQSFIDALGRSFLASISIPSGTSRYAIGICPVELLD